MAQFCHGKCQASKLRSIKFQNQHDPHRNKIAEMGAYVKLLEYDNIDGMILLSELSRRRIRSIQKLIRVGRNEVVVVLRVDKDKGMSAISVC